MSSLIASSPTFRDDTVSADLDRQRETGQSWVWTLVEALAYAGASFDPTAALAARRLARLRDEELRPGR
jgi:hypothetical protein